MANPSLLSSIFFFFLILSACLTPTLSKKSTYIVHVSHSHKPIMLSAHDWYFSILHSTLTSPSNTSTNSMPDLMYTYSHSATGFAAHITATQAARLRGLPFVLSVAPDEVVELATTRSPGFLGLSDRPDNLWPKTDYGSGIIIGVVDTGIWPESRSFRDVGIGNVPAKWRGTCVSGPDFPASLCNKKLIGARYFFSGYEAEHGPVSMKSARDETGHGTHCASIAAGSPVSNADYLGYASGEARGVGVKAHVAAYKVFWGQPSSASSADILAAIDAAIDDGVDVLSLSLGNSAVDYYQDEKAVASFRAMEKGIVVSAAAGNSGPNSLTVTNVSPWMLTVAASSIDRQFLAHVELGNGMVFTGSTLYDFRHLPNNPTAPATLVTGRDAGNPFCLAGERLRSSVAGKIVICEASKSISSFDQSIAVQQAGGVGIILHNTLGGEELQAFPYVIPGTIVTYSDGNSILFYVYSNPNPMARIYFGGTTIGSSPSAPRLAAFSSRGPNKITRQILKPDVTAPGLNILAAWIGPDYNIQSGTSMACPHVSGLGALLRKAHPSWSPSAIKSAIMTTSYNRDNAGSDLIDLLTGRQSSPFVHGSGHIDPEKAADPGLVYDLDTNDYIAFLCSIGYSPTTIAQFAGRDPSTINCQTNPLSSPGDLNYPSFSVVFNSAKDMVRYTRVVKNVGSSVNAVYRVSVTEPPSVRVNVSPTTLEFSANRQTLSYTISFTSVGRLPTPSFGFVEWSDGSHRVRSPIAASWPFRELQNDSLASA